MKFSEFKYEHLELEDLKKEYEEKLSQLKACDNADSFMKVFHEINKFRGHVFSMQTICSIRHTINTADEYYDKENDYWDNTMPLLQECEVELSKIVLDCPFRKELPIPETFDKLALNTLRSFSNEIIEDLQEENRLSSEYGKLRASAKIEFEGEVYNLASIGPKLSDPDREVRKNAVKATQKFYEDNENKFDEIYDKLVKLRDKMAKKLGFNNFVELGYIRMNRLDYDETMVSNYRKQVLEDIVPLSVELRAAQAERIGVDKLEYYDSSYKFKTGNPKPRGNEKELVEAALKMYTSISKETGEFFKMMVDQELFDLTTKPNKEMGGYCTDIFDYKAPFIFSNFNGTQGDVDVLTHEAGHAFQSYLSCKEIDIPDLCFPTMESCEIHSMSMEFFAHPYSELFFKEDADKYHYLHIMDSVNFLPYGVLVDHFQHEVYHNPNMSKEERKATWRRLEKMYKPDVTYTDSPLLEKGGYFYMQGHIFQAPFYYIDYTLAQVCALQFFVRALNNDPEYWNDYVNICKVGGTKSFTQIVKLANLKVPFEDGCLKEVASKMREELNKIDSSSF